MANDKPYLWLGQTTPGNYALEIEIVSPSHDFDLNNPTSVAINNDRLTITYTSGTGAHPASKSITLTNNVKVLTSETKWDSALQKITVNMMNGTTVLGSSTVLTQKADPYTNLKPKIWLEHQINSDPVIHTGNALSFGNPNDDLTTRTRTYTTQSGAANSVTLNSTGLYAFDPSRIDIITIKVNNPPLGEVGEGSTNTSDGDASGDGKDLMRIF